MVEKRRSLGRGLGGLFPENQKEVSKDRPINVFFSGGRDEASEDAQSTGKPAEKATEKAPAAKVPQPIPELNEDEKSKVQPGLKEPKQRDRKKIATSDLPESVEDPASTDQDGELLPIPGATFGEIPVAFIVPNQKQPREIFDEDDLQELADSIAEVGVLQPIVVRPLKDADAESPDAQYELIMGERRWRASQRAGKETIPAIVRHTDDSDLLRDALLENLHRAQLNPLEEAAAYQQLLDDFSCTQEELSRRIARSRPQISNTLRLLKLPPLVQRRVAAGIISAGHARALLGLTDPAGMERLAQRIVAESLSVRAVEEMVALGDIDSSATTRRPRTSQYAAELNELARRLQDRFNTRVKVKMGQRKGSITIDFATIDDLNRILDVIEEDGVDVVE